MIAVRTLHRAQRFPHAEAARLVRLVARGEGVLIRSLSLVLVGDRFMRELNRRHLRHDWTTDVLSFSYGTWKVIEGEIVVNLDQAKRQAPDFGATTGQEIRRLIVHGMLHLAGHEDRTHALRQRMHRREDRYLRPSS